MKAVLISIQPKWVEKIASGEKTVEVRKTRPKLETPFKCYIYCTRGRTTETLLIGKDGQVVFGDYRNACTCDADGNVDYFVAEGNVIGEFVCECIEDFSQWQFDYFSLLRHINLYAGTNYKYLDTYLKGQKKGYGWHISQLKIYDKPRELSEFWTVDCKNKKGSCLGCEVKPNCIKTITRPPQSWCYIEELGDNENEKQSDTAWKAVR